MKIAFALATALVILFLWMVDSGYRQFSLLRDFGMEKYSSLTEKASSTVEAVISKVSAQTPSSTSTSYVVTHVKTPEHVRAIYMSSWVAGAPSIRAKLVKLIEDTELNAIVIDVKDNTGVITWEERTRDLPEFLDELHKKNIYVIARISVFQDPKYVKAHPEQAVLSKATGGIWKDHKGIPWVDTGSKDMWKYIEELSKETYARGFDEINLDYIRFPTDGALSDMVFPVSGERAKTDKPGIVGDFYRYITGALRAANIPVSGDLFGIIMVTDVDIKTLGQDLAVALQTFDYVAPMVYPSHFYKGTAGYDNPAAHPGPIIAYSMGKGAEIADRVASSTGQSTSTLRAKLRPWYQDFDMGATYTAEMVRAQIAAGEKLGIETWMLWDPANKYTPSALKVE